MAKTMKCWIHVKGSARGTFGGAFSIEDGTLTLTRPKTGNQKNPTTVEVNVKQITAASPAALREAINEAGGRALSTLGKGIPPNTAQYTGDDEAMPKSKKKAAASK